MPILPDSLAIRISADNRYKLTAGDLPNLAALRARGIGRVLKITYV